MIYTSFFGNYKNFPKKCLICAVCRYPPQGIIKFEVLAPNEDLLKKFKSKEVDEFIFEVEYKKQLELLDKNKWENALKKLNEIYDNVILCCYEKTGDFCHRYILADWLNNLNIKELKKI